MNVPVHSICHVIVSLINFFEIPQITHNTKQDSQINIYKTGIFQSSGL